MKDRRKVFSKTDDLIIRSANRVDIGKTFKMKPGTKKIVYRKIRHAGEKLAEEGANSIFDENVKEYFKSHLRNRMASVGPGVNKTERGEGTKATTD